MHGGGGGDPTPRTLRRSAAQEFGDSWRSPSVQKYLGTEFSKGAPCSPAGASSSAALSADVRLQQVLASIQRKDELAASPAAQMPGLGADASGGIGAYKPPICDSLSADYRSQLQRYAQQLAAKDAEAAALRLHVDELKRQLVSAEGRAAHASEQVARNAAQAGQLEQAAAALEHQLQEREQELQQAQHAKRAAEQVAAAAKAQAAAVQKSVTAKAQEVEADRRFFKEQLERKDAELHSLEDALKKQSTELDKRGREWTQREAELSAVRSRSQGAAAAVHAELEAVQSKLDAAVKRARGLEVENVELRRQKAQVAADMRMVEELLRDSDAERKELHDKYVRLGERMEALVKESKMLRSSASAEAGAARTAAHEAIKDAEVALKERASLLSQVQLLKQQLETEQAGRSELKDRVQRKLAAAEQEVSLLRSELDTKARQLQGLQADMKGLQAEAEAKLGACEKQLVVFKERIAALKQEVEQERQRGSKAQADAEALHQERMRLELQQQSLKYERRIQELELQALQGGTTGAPVIVCPASPGPRNTSISTAAASVLDYIPRAEHVRLLEARLAAKEGDMQLELNSRVAQAEREWQWKLEGKEQEIAALTSRCRQLEDDLHRERQRSSSQAQKAGDEARQLISQCAELKRELDVQSKEAARLKEALKDVRSANAEMDDDAMSSSRQVARLKSALQDSQHTLKEAQEALGQERKRREEAQREAEGHAARLQDALQRAERLAAEVGELQGALEQRQELVSALQAESDAWSAKLMAHREYHEREMAALKKQLKEEGDGQMLALEQKCLAQGEELCAARKQHEATMAQLRQQHAAQVVDLEKQLAAAERCAVELRQLSTALGPGKSQDVEALKLQLKESLLERERLQKQHSAQLAVIAGQIKASMAGVRSQQAQLKQQVEGDVAAACAECLSSYQAGLDALQQQLQRQQTDAASQQAELVEQAAQLRYGMEQLLGALQAELPWLASMLPDMQQVLVGSAAGGSPSNHQHQHREQQVASAVQQVVRSIQVHVEQAEAAVLDSALVALEAALLPPRSPSPPHAASPPKVLSPSKRRQQQPESVAVQAPSMEANEGRLQALLSRCQQLLSRLEDSEVQVGQLRQQVATLETTAAGFEDKLTQAQTSAVQAADAARVASVAPLQAEVARLTERVQSLQQLHNSELAAIQAAAQQQVAASRAEAQAAVDRLTASGSSLQHQLRGEKQRGEELSADLSRMQDELAKHTQRAASKIELQERELELLKGRIREMEARDAAAQQEPLLLRGLRQREREAAGRGLNSSLSGIGGISRGSAQQL